MKRAKAYSSSGSVVTHRSTNRTRRRVTSFQLKRVTNYATPPTPVPWRYLVDKLKKPVTSACYDKQHVCAYLQPCSRYTR